MISNRFNVSWLAALFSNSFIDHPNKDKNLTEHPEGTVWHGGIQT